MKVSASTSPEPNLSLGAGSPQFPRLYAISDLHVGYAENRQLITSFATRHVDDWLLVAGDVGEIFSDIVETLRSLTNSFAKVIWTPGNHELWSHPRDPVQLKGVDRYDALVSACRELGVLTPEDDYQMWNGAAHPHVIAPLLTLYDYSWRPPHLTKAESLAWAKASGVYCTDEYFLQPEPYACVSDWCETRVRETSERLESVDPLIPLILLNHFPLTPRVVRRLRHPQFAQWCGTERTEAWHRRFNVAAVITGHLHIPHIYQEEGTLFMEASYGYPRERQAARSVELPTQVPL